MRLVIIYGLDIRCNTHLLLVTSDIESAREIVARFVPNELLSAI